MTVWRVPGRWKISDGPGFRSRCVKSKNWRRRGYYKGFRHSNFKLVSSFWWNSFCSLNNFSNPMCNNTFDVGRRGHRSSPGLQSSRPFTYTSPSLIRTRRGRPSSTLRTPTWLWLQKVQSESPEVVRSRLLLLLDVSSTTGSGTLTSIWVLSHFDFFVKTTLDLLDVRVDDGTWLCNSVTDGP